MIDTRINRNLDAAVNRGLAAAFLVNAQAGQKIMRNAGVPPEVVTRLLRSPQQCRATDWKR